jgi:hypothetical protein
VGGNKGPSNAGCTDDAAATAAGGAGPDTVSGTADADIGSRFVVETPMPQLLSAVSGGEGGATNCCMCCVWWSAAEGKRFKERVDDVSTNPEPPGPRSEGPCVSASAQLMKK